MSAPRLLRTVPPRLAPLLAPLLAIILLAAPVAGAPAEEEPLRLDEDLIAEVIELLQERYVDQDAVTSENLSLGAIRGIVEALGDDGHTEYLTEREFEFEQEVLEGRVAGIGVVLDHRAGTPLVVAVVDGSPAARAGVRTGDVIVSVDGTETMRLPTGELAELVRGEPGSDVELGIERPGREGLEIVRIRREEVEIDPVGWAMAPGSDVAVIRVVQFSLGAGAQVRDALEAAVRAGAVGVVLDLRGNPGGLVNETLTAASAFLDDGVVFFERARDAVTTPVEVEAGRSVDAYVPVVVVVDYGTASAGEILAAALRDNQRATVLGERTFGTGTILNTLRLSDGSALRLGVREWLTPAGVAVFRVGLEPDEVVVLPAGALRLGPADLLRLTPGEFAATDDLQLLRAVRAAEAAVAG